MGIQKNTATLEDSLAISYKIKHSLTIQSKSCTSWYLTKWVENLRGHKNLHMNVYNSFIHNYQNLEATKMFSNKWMDIQIGIYNEIIFNDKKKWAIKPQKDVSIAEWKKSVWKTYILYGSNNMKFWKWQSCSTSKKISERSVVTRSSQERR